MEKYIKLKDFDKEEFVKVNDSIQHSDDVVKIKLPQFDAVQENKFLDSSGNIITEQQFPYTLYTQDQIERLVKGKKPACIIDIDGYEASLYPIVLECDCIFSFDNDLTFTMKWNHRDSLIPNVCFIASYSNGYCELVSLTNVDGEISFEYDCGIPFGTSYTQNINNIAVEDDGNMVLRAMGR